MRDVTAPTGAASTRGPIRVRRNIHRLLALAFAFAINSAAAQGQLNIICSVQLPWCEAVVTQFQKDTGIKIGMTQKSAGEAMAQVAAERANPKVDVWYTGSGDPHLQAAELGLTEEYRSPMLSQLQEWAVRQAEQSQYHTVGVYTGALGIGYNPEILAKRKLPEPKCWADLANPIYRDEVQMANPNASGTAYATIATFVQIFGEDKAFELLKGMHRNINNYPRSGPGAIRAVGRGETGIAVTFLHDGVTEIAGGFPVKIVVPCEGTGYEVGSMSIIKGARNLDNAKKFYDWALTPAAQKIGADTKNYQTPSNKAAPAPPGAPKMDEIKLINYDFAKYGSAAERKRLLEKWDREVAAMPR
ncbi:MAG: ABC transporter substrate-binding protein [Betaproteobacteria bacterium]|nr:MAG: ABC transporter substrate-binding protein [Betaproteobacteria bacterium]